MKKVISLFLSAMMILTSVLCVNFSAFAQDIESGSIKLGKNTVKASEFFYEDDEVVETKSTYYWYSFVPDETAVYRFESHYTVSDDTDPMIYLCDKNKNEITDYDDIDSGNGNYNFRLQTSLIKGETYYLYFGEYNNSSSFDFTVDKTKISFSFTLAQKHTLAQGYDSYIDTDDNGDEYDYYYLSNVIYSEGNTITETKEDGTLVTYTCKNTKENEDDEDNFRFVDGDGNSFPYRIDCNSAQNINHLKTGDNVQCYFTVRSDDYNIDVPFTIDIKEFEISGITLNLAQKHTLTQGYDSYINTDDNGDERPTRSFLYNVSTDGFSNIASNGLALEDQVFQYQFDTIRKVAEEGSCIIVGRCADYILKEDEALLTIFLHASDKFREKRVIEKYGVEPKNVAKEMKNTDKKRAKFHNFYSEEKWGEATTYDLAINVAKLGIDGTVDLISEYIKAQG